MFILTEKEGKLALHSSLHHLSEIVGITLEFTKLLGRPNYLMLIGQGYSEDIHQRYAISAIATSKYFKRSIPSTVREKSSLISLRNN